VAFDIRSGNTPKTQSKLRTSCWPNREKPKLCSNFLDKRLLKTYVSLCKSCSLWTHLQLLVLEILKFGSKFWSLNRSNSPTPKGVQAGALEPSYCAEPAPGASRTLTVRRGPRSGVRATPCRAVSWSHLTPSPRRRAYPLRQICRHAPAHPCVTTHAHPAAATHRHIALRRPHQADVALEWGASPNNL
jgi:hypothetical protein